MSKVKRVPVCWLECGTNLIKWSNVVNVEGKGDSARVRFDDGGWNPATDCFLTERQCREHNSMVNERWGTRLLAENLKLRKIVESIELLIDWSRNPSSK